jgi:hypothetical protein
MSCFIFEEAGLLAVLIEKPCGGGDHSLAVTKAAVQQQVEMTFVVANADVLFMADQGGQFLSVLLSSQTRNSICLIFCCSIFFKYFSSSDFYFIC